MSIYTISDSKGVVSVGTSAKKIVALAYASVGKRHRLVGGEKFNTEFRKMKDTLNDERKLEIVGNKGQAVVVTSFPDGNRDVDNLLMKRYRLQSERSGRSFKAIPRKAKSEVKLAS